MLVTEVRHCKTAFIAIVVTSRKFRLVCIVSDTLLVTCLSVADAELEVYALGILHERLVADVPSQ